MSGHKRQRERNAHRLVPDVYSEVYQNMLYRVDGGSMRQSEQSALGVALRYDGNGFSWCRVLRTTVGLRLWTDAVEKEGFVDSRTHES